MRDAVIVSTARTPIGRAYRGAFNATPSPTLAAHAIRAAVERSGLRADEVDDQPISAVTPAPPLPRAQQVTPTASIKNDDDDEDGPAPGNAW